MMMLSNSNDILCRRFRQVESFLSSSKFFRKLPKPWSYPLQQAIWACLIEDTTFQAVVQWGVGTRSAVGPIEQSAVGNLGEIFLGLQSVGEVRFSVTVLVTDIHARNNGIPGAVIKDYVESLSEEVASRSWVVKTVSQVLGTVESNTLLEICQDDDYVRFRWNRLRPDLQRRLADNARRRCLEDSSTLAAMRYVAICELEGGLIARAIPKGFLFSYQSPELAFLLPSMPTILVYVEPGGGKLRPWYG